MSSAKGRSGRRAGVGYGPAVEALEGRRLLSAGPALVHTTASLSVARAGVAAVSVAGKAVFAGGRLVDGTPSDAVDIFDARTGRWSTARLSEARKDLVGAVVGGKAMFAPGYGGTAISDVVDVYDAATGSWSVGRLSESRAEVATAVVGTKALFVGGWRGGDAYSDVVDVYDSATGRWSTTRMPHRAQQPSALTVGDKVLVTGVGPGAEGGVVDVYDGVTGRWSTVVPPLDHPWGGRVVGGKAIFRAGGGLDVYDMLSGTWTAAVAPTYLVTGGETAGRRAIFSQVTTIGAGMYEGPPRAWAYDTVTGVWTVASPDGWSGGGTVLGERVVYVVGEGRAPLEPPWGGAGVYNAGTGAATELITLAAARWDLGATTVGPVALLAGGDLGWMNDPEAGVSAAVDVFTDPAPAAALDGWIARPGGGWRAVVNVRNAGDAALAGAYDVIVYGARDGRRSVVLGRARATKALAAGAAGRVSVALDLPAGTRLADFRLVAAAAPAGQRDEAFAAETTMPQFTAALADAPALIGATAKEYEFTVVYHGPYGVDPNTLDGDDVVVTGPNGYSQKARFVSWASGKRGGTRVAVYAVSGPGRGGAWGAGADGAYVVHVQDSQVRDAISNPVPSKRIGAFTVAIGAGAGGFADSPTVGR